MKSEKPVFRMKSISYRKKKKLDAVEFCCKATGSRVRYVGLSSIDDVRAMAKGLLEMADQVEGARACETKRRSAELVDDLLSEAYSKPVTADKVPDVQAEGYDITCEPEAVVSGVPDGSITVQKGCMTVIDRASGEDGCTVAKSSGPMHPVASITHRCHWCGEDIEVGTKYTKYVMSGKNGFAITKLHNECEDAIDRSFFYTGEDEYTWCEFTQKRGLAIDE